MKPDILTDLDKIERLLRQAERDAMLLDGRDFKRRRWAEAYRMLAMLREWEDAQAAELKVLTGANNRAHEDIYHLIQERDDFRAGLERLASMEGFEGAGYVAGDSFAERELRARGQYASDVLCAKIRPTEALRGGSQPETAASALSDLGRFVPGAEDEALRGGS